MAYSTNFSPVPSWRKCLFQIPIAFNVFVFPTSHLYYSYLYHSFIFCIDYSFLRVESMSDLFLRPQHLDAEEVQDEEMSKENAS